MSRIAVIAVIVEKKEATERLNSILHDYGEYIIGRIDEQLSPHPTLL